MTAAARRDLDQLWQILVSVVMDTRGDWRKKISEASGLPFNRMRALRRLGGGPLTMTELRETMDCDAPTATNIVNDLEERGLVERTTQADDRRCKKVALTEEGKVRLARARTVVDIAPAGLAELSVDDVAHLTRILGPLVKQ
jgi:DNA-binding MarR family transcriptional regulator